MIVREDIFGALFDLASGAGGFVTKSRKLKHWSDVQPSEMPALFQAQGVQQAVNMTGQPTRWEMYATLWIYVSTMDFDSPGEALNPILDALCNQFEQVPFLPTLSGLVAYVRIDGAIETSEGTLGDIEVARVPIKMLTA